MCIRDRTQRVVNGSFQPMLFEASVRAVTFAALVFPSLMSRLLSSGVTVFIPVLSLIHI